MTNILPATAMLVRCCLQMSASHLTASGKHEAGAGGFPTRVIVEGPWAPQLLANMLKATMGESATPAVARSLHCSLHAGGTGMDPTLMDFMHAVIHLLGDLDSVDTGSGTNLNPACGILVEVGGSIMLTAHQAAQLQRTIENSLRLTDVQSTLGVTGAARGVSGGGCGAAVLCSPGPSLPVPPTPFSEELWAEAWRVAEHWQWAADHKDELDDIDVKVMNALRLQCGQAPLEGL